MDRRLRTDHGVRRGKTAANSSSPLVYRSFVNVIRRTSVWVVLATFIVVATLGCSSGGNRSEILVFAATSLIDALEEAEKAFEADYDISVAVNTGSSQGLAQQIARGAPADIFISAGFLPMNFLAEDGVVDLVSNELVLVTPSGGAALGSIQELANADIKRVAIANPDMAPAGAYARESLKNLGLWNKLRGRLVMGADVRVALAYVESGNAEFAIVYRTDAKVSDTVTTLDIVPPNSYSKIVYPATIVRGSKKKKEAQSFLDFIQSRAAAAIFRKHGFVPLMP